MIQVQETLDVDRPIEEVFGYVADFSNVAEWDPGVVASTQREVGAIAPGTSYDVTVRFYGFDLPMRYDVTVYDAPHRIVLRGSGDTVDGIDTIRFDRTPRGTRITYTAELSLRGFYGVFEPVLGWLFDRVAKDAIGGLQAKLEQAHPATSATSTSAQI